MLDVLNGEVGVPTVITTNNRGLTPDEIIEMTMDRILSVSVTAPTAIREQALTYRHMIRTIVLDALKEAVMHDRVTVANALVNAGAPELAAILKEI